MRIEFSQSDWLRSLRPASGRVHQNFRFCPPPQDSACADSQPGREQPSSIHVPPRPAQNYLMMPEHSRSLGLVALGADRSRLRTANRHSGHRLQPRKLWPFFRLVRST